MLEYSATALRVFTTSLGMRGHFGARRNSLLQRYNNVTYQPRKMQRVYNVVNYKKIGKINTYQDTGNVARA